VQHADLDSGASYWGRLRHYRDAVEKARKAAAAWTEQKCIFGLDLGDIIDRGSPDPSRSLQNVLAAFTAFQGQVHHSPGNHEVSSLPRSELLSALAPASASCIYHEFSPYDGWRVVCLDTYDLAHKSTPEGDSRHHEMAAMYSVGRAAEDIAFMDHPELNGGVGSEQLAWFERILTRAHEQAEKLVIFSHAPLYPPVTVDGYAVCWNHRELLSLIHRFPGTVVLCLSGHDHEGSHRVDGKGIHHVLLEAALEAEVGSESHAVVSVYDNRLVLKGAGNVRSHSMDLSILSKIYKMP